MKTDERMDNIGWSIDENNILYLAIDLTKDCGTTKGGNIMVASSKFWKPLDDAAVVERLGKKFDLSLALIARPLEAIEAKKRAKREKRKATPKDTPAPEETAPEIVAS